MKYMTMLALLAMALTSCEQMMQKKEKAPEKQEDGTTKPEKSSSEQK